MPQSWHSAKVPAIACRPAGAVAGLTQASTVHAVPGDQPLPRSTKAPGLFRSNAWPTRPGAYCTLPTGTPSCGPTLSSALPSPLYQSIRLAGAAVQTGVSVGVAVGPGVSV